MKLVLGLAIGMAFGAILQMGGASSYRKIMGALLLKDMSIIKLILTGIAVATVGVYTLDLMDLANLSIKTTYIAGIAVAGLIFGVGFAVSGYCPGTCVAAAGEGKVDALFTILGGLVGAGLYAMTYPMFKGLIGHSNYGEITFADVFNVPPLYLAIPFSAILLLLSFRLLKDKY